MPIRTHIALPLAAGLLTCLTIGLAMRLSAHTAAHTPMPAHAAAPRAADGLLPLSRLPATATDKQRMTAWLQEAGEREYIQAMMMWRQAGLHGSPGRMTMETTPMLHYGALTYAHNVLVTPQKRVLRPIYAHPTTHAQAVQMMTVAVDDGSPRRFRMTFTRTASSLHVASTFLPDQPLTR